MSKVKLTAVGNSIGIELPKDVIEKLNVGRGDTLYLVESGLGFILTAYDPEFYEQMATAGGIMKRYRNTLSELS